MLFKVERVAPGVHFFYIRSGPWCGGGQRRRYNFVCLVPPTRTLLFIGFIVILYALLVVCGRDVTYTARPDLLPAWLLPSPSEDAASSSGYLRSIITAVYLTAAGNIISTIGFVLGALMAIETVCVDPGLLLPDVPPDGDLACTARHNAALNVNGIYAEHFDHDGAYRQACEAYRTSFCKTCLHYRPLKSAHCPLCGVCVLDMDHHCTVLGRCIGGRNLRYFLALMVVAAAIGWRIGVQFLAFVMCRLSATVLGASTHGSPHHQSCAHDHHTPITPARDALAIFGMVASFAVAGGVSFLLSNYARSLCVPGAEAPRVGFWRRWCSKQAPNAAGGDAGGDAASPNTVVGGEAMSVAERIKATPIDPATGNPILSVPSWHPAYEAELKRWQAEREQAAAEESAAESEKGQPADWRAALRRYRERWLTLPWVHALAPRTPTMISIWLRERPVREWAAARRRGGVWYPNMQRKPLGIEGGGDGGEGADTAVEVAPMMVEGEEEIEEFVA